MSRMPPLKYERAPCPQCGATCEDDAATLCTAGQDVTGEYECSGEFDKAGWSIQPTDASLKAMDTWIERQMANER